VPLKSDPLRFFARREGYVNEERGGGHGDKAEDAALRADSAAGEPDWAVKRGVRKMPFKDRTAIGNRK